MDTPVSNIDITSFPAADPEMEAMLDAGVHRGHNRSKRHPAMGQFVWGTRSNIEIIDLLKTREKLAEALHFLHEIASRGKLILFVGTRPSTHELLRETAESLGYPYVNRRWIGGTLTNFKVIFKRVETLESLEQDKATGGFEKYTKKERLVKEDVMNRLRQNFDGLRKLRRLPDAVIIMGIHHDTLALAEARGLNIPVVALTDTNTDPRLATYPIPSNDDARTAVRYMLSRIHDSLRDGQDHPATPPVPEVVGGTPTVAVAVATAEVDSSVVSTQ